MPFGILTFTHFIAFIIEELKLMEELYKPQELEQSLQKYWLDNDTFRAVEDPSKEKYYCL